MTQDVFLAAVQGMADWDRKAAEIRAGRNGFRKKVKAQGIVLGLLDSTLKKADWERKEVQDHYATERQYAEWLGLPVGTQIDMFGDHVPEDDEIRARHWHAAGVTAARVGKPRVLPSDCGPKYGPMWDRGYDGEPFVWDIAKTSIASAAAATQAPVGKGKADKPAASAGKRTPASKAKKVAGLITPPAAVHTPETEAAAKAKADAGADIPADDGFGPTNGTAGFDVVH